MSLISRIGWSPARGKHRVKWFTSSLSLRPEGAVEVAFPGGEVWVQKCGDKEGHVLRFTLAEWDAFIGGILLGEFGTAVPARLLTAAGALESPLELAEEPEDEELREPDEPASGVVTWPVPAVV